MLKVLLVDDEKFAIEGLISMLDWQGFEGELVGTACSGEEALGLLPGTRPDIIISDIKMGGMNGIELARIVSQSRENMQLILLTAHSEFEFARRAIQYGVIDYVLKPITREKIAQLNDLLRQKNRQLITQRRSLLTVWDDSLKEKLTEALRMQDQSVLDEFFQSELYGELMSGSNCNPIGVQLLNYLYAYLEEIRVNKDALSYSRSETMETFLEITGKREKMDFIITKYYDLTTSTLHLKHSHTDAIAAYAFQYIDSHFTDPDFNLSGLSYAMHVSLSHLSTVFKQTTGSNLSAYVSDLRLERAKSLLADMRYSIAEVSRLSGYSDAKYFAKLFKRKNGVTPSEYRNISVQGESHGN